MEHNSTERFKAIIPLFGSVLALTIYLSGIGRYKMLLVIAGYYLLESYLLYRRTSTSSIKPIFGPSVAIAAIIDIMQEGTFPLRLIGAFVLFIMAELVSKKHLVALIEGLTQLRLFGRCPSCNYANRDPVKKCKYCGFTANLGPAAPQLDVLPVTMPVSGCAGITAKVPKRCLSLLNLREGEKCIGGVRIFPERGLYEDGGKVLVKYLVITNARLILLDYHFYYSGWTYRRDIGIGSVEASIMVRKHHQKKEVPILTLKTPETSYEVFYSPYMSARKEIEAIRSCINSLSSHESSQSI